jgi:hypothetical protein
MAMSTPVTGSVETSRVTVSRRVNPLTRSSPRTPPMTLFQRKPILGSAKARRAAGRGRAGHLAARRRRPVLQYFSGHPAVEPARPPRHGGRRRLRGPDHPAPGPTRSPSMDRPASCSRRSDAIATAPHTCT